MSSLLQSNQPITRRGVGILLYLVKPEGDGSPGWIEREPTPCPTCGREHAKLYRIYRKPAGLWGHWVVFRINGQECLPDLSCPTRVTKLPRGAEPVDLQEWHR